MSAFTTNTTLFTTNITPFTTHRLTSLCTFCNFATANPERRNHYSVNITNKTMTAQEKKILSDAIEMLVELRDKEEPVVNNRSQRANVRNGSIPLPSSMRQWL